MRTTLRRSLIAGLVAVCTTAASFVVGIGPADASVTATVRTQSGGLRVRSGPTLQSSVVGLLSNWSRVQVSCFVVGQYVNGTVRKTRQWNRLTSGRYVSAAFTVANGTIKRCDAPTPPPAKPAPGPVGKMTKAQFIAASVAPAQASRREYGVPVSVTIAQAIIESGWGRSSLTDSDRNFFGIKCFDGVHGPIAVGCHSYRTSECTPGCYRTTASFRVYRSATDSFRDHGRFLTVNSRYRWAFTYKNDPHAFLWMIWIAGYATSPTYYSTVSKIMRDYNLYQYDLR